MLLIDYEAKQHAYLILWCIQVCLECENRTLVCDITILSIKVVNHLNPVDQPCKEDDCFDLKCYS